MTSRTFRETSLRIALPCALLVALAACASAPPAAPTTALTSATPVQMVATIRASAGDGEGELSVQPLRDNEVEDLRDQAHRLEAQGHVADAAKALDHAIEIVPGDPALLQERAEVALLLGDRAAAASLAERAFALGSQVGPLCRRHWTTLEQVRLLEGDAAGAAAARAAVDACRIGPPARY
ncbi:hypothetical protein [Luteimonas sp. MC1825]|uniref:hypothetical protein n=1 Tax=Luteimonas sp. MC1825 TaxID=2761107 RepID=UPI001610D37E|nr:hypothetical protein [Luteimonas sp. MC1825]MBB6599933.1 hypothetical protein [Luteimonas sp. MC1825]QOC89577.1 hypothetical protein IDM46_10395 [Luteimonas sp. MC1825]